MSRLLRGPRPLTAAQQYWGLQRSALSTGVGRLRRNQLRWEFAAQPTPLARTYRVRIDYEFGDTPLVHVVHPDLVDLAGGRRLPHVYRQKPPRLCLYLPRAGEWQPHMLLVDTIVPWSILWLFYFEDWLETNEWQGGGVHPASDEDDAANPVN